MWTKIQKTYSGKLGMFVIGQKYDLTEATIKQFPKGTAVQCCAPWDEKIDTKAVAKLELVKNAKAAKMAVERIEEKLTETTERRDAVKKFIGKAEVAAGEAHNDFVLANKKKAKNAEGLKRESYRKQLIVKKEIARFETLAAECDLFEMEIEDAKQKANEAARKAEMPEPFPGSKPEGDNAVTGG